MGHIDTITKEYMRDNRVFADVCNCFFKQKLVSPDALQEIDTTEIFVSDIWDNEEDTAQKARDVVKECAVAMADDKVSYVIFGVENQTHIDYSMAMRVYIYNAMRYSAQLRDITRAHKALKDLKGTERLSQFGKTDRFKPVITIVVYYGEEPWNASLDLYGLLADGSENLRPFINNFTITVIELSKLSDEVLMQFQSDLREVASFLKYAKDGDKLKEVIQSNENFQTMDILAAKVVKALTGSQIEIDESQEEFNMCKAITDLETKAENRGLEKGMLEGRLEGRLEGKMEGKLEGKLEERRNIVIAMQESGMSVETIASVLKTTAEEIETLIAQRTA